MNPGINLLAIEVFRRNGDNNDILFDLEVAVVSDAQLVRGPYLQMGTPTSAVVR